MNRMQFTCELWILETTLIEYKLETLEILFCKNFLCNTMIQFWFVKCIVITRIRKNFEQLFIPIQAMQGDDSVLM